MKALIYSLLFLFMAPFSAIAADVEGIAFFADGVVFESRQLEYTAWNWAFNQMGHEISQEEWQSWIGMNREELTELFYQNYGCTWDPSVFELKQNEYALIFAKGITPRLGALSLIERIQNVGLPVVLITKTPVEQTLLGLEKVGLENTFSRIIYLPELTDQDDYLYITDSGRTAQRLASYGFKSIGARSQWTIHDDFSSSEFVVDDLNEIMFGSDGS